MNTNIYFKSVLEKKIYIELNNVNNNLDDNILKILKNDYEGKCSNDGYIKNDSIKIITYSSGIIIDKYIKFDIIFECMLCYPVEGMIIECIIKNITKAGLRCVIDEENSPLIIFVARDYHYTNTIFNNLNENDKINIKIIGQRVELNDPYICIISEFIDKVDKSNTNKEKSKSKKSKLKILDD